MARVIFTPEEQAGDDESAAGWSAYGSGATTFLTTETRTDINGNGGAYGIRLSVSGLTGYFKSPQFDGLNHYYGKFGALGTSVSSDWRINMDNSGSTTLAYIECTALGAPTVGDSTGVLGTSTGGPLTLNQWYLIEYEVLHLGGGLGIFKLWIDGALVVNYSGNVAVGPVHHMELQGNTAPWMDDLALNSITMRYDTGGGTFAPSAGDTITGTAGGAPTAVVTSVDGTTTAGTMTVQAWDGTAFTDGQVITESGGSTTAQVDAPTAGFVDGFEPNSSQLGNEFLTYVKPTAEGTTIELTPSTGADNSANVDNVPPSTSTYNEASAVDQQDTYDTNASTQIPEDVTITMVAAGNYARSALAGIDGLRPIVRIGSTDYYLTRHSLSSSHSVTWREWHVQPSDDAAWLRATLVAAGFEHGCEFVA